MTYTEVIRFILDMDTEGKLEPWQKESIENAAEVLVKTNASNERSRG